MNSSMISEKRQILIHICCGGMAPTVSQRPLAQFYRHQRDSLTYPLARATTRTKFAMCNVYDWVTG